MNKNKRKRLRNKKRRTVQANFAIFSEECKTVFSNTEIPVDEFTSKIKKLLSEHPELKKYFI